MLRKMDAKFQRLKRLFWQSAILECATAARLTLSSTMPSWCEGRMQVLRQQPLSQSIRTAFAQSIPIDVSMTRGYRQLSFLSAGEFSLSRYFDDSNFLRYGSTSGANAGCLRNLAK